MSEQLEAAHRLPEMLEALRWDGGVRIVLQGAILTKMRDGSMDMQSRWRADVFYSRRKKADFSFVADTPREVLEQLGALAAGVVTDADD